MDTPTRKPPPSDDSDDDLELLAFYLGLMREYAPWREYPSRASFNAHRYPARAGCQ
jgi:hypothetical protein